MRRCRPSSPILRTGTASLLAIACTSAASAEEVRITLGGTVPQICRIEAETGSGTLQEFCNAPGGYDIYVDSGPDAAGAILIIDGQETRLAADPARIASSTGPARRTRTLQIVPPSPEQTVQIVFRIVPR
jgi:hypothetical protein